MNSKEKLKKIMSVLGIKSQYFYEAKSEQGITFKIEGDMEVGSPIYVQTEEGLIPAPDGQHMLDDGCMVDVVDGKVAKIQYQSAAPAKQTDDMAPEMMSIESPDISMEGDIKTNDGKVLRPARVPAHVGVNVKMVQYDGTLTAVPDGLYTDTNGDVYEIVGAEIKSVRTASQMKELKSNFAEAKSKSGHKIMAPSFEQGEPITFEGIDGVSMEVPDGSYELEMGDGAMMKVMVKDGMIESVGSGDMEDSEEEATEVGEDMKVPHSPESPSVKMSEVEALFKKSFAEFAQKLDAITAKQEELERKFFKFSNLPAGERVKNNTPNNKLNSEEVPSPKILESFRRMRESLS